MRCHSLLLCRGITGRRAIEEYLLKWNGFRDVRHCHWRGNSFFTKRILWISQPSSEWKENCCYISNVLLLCAALLSIYRKRIIVMTRYTCSDKRGFCMLAYFWIVWECLNYFLALLLWNWIFFVFAGKRDSLKFAKLPSWVSNKFIADLQSGIMRLNSPFERPLSHKWEENSFLKILIPQFCSAQITFWSNLVFHCLWNV